MNTIKDTGDTASELDVTSTNLDVEELEGNKKSLDIATDKKSELDVISSKGDTAKSWEGEFDLKFPYGWINWERGINGEEIVIDRIKDIKDFIRTLLKEQREGIYKNVNIKLGCDNGCGFVEPYGFVPECDCPIHDSPEQEIKLLDGDIVDGDTE